MIKGTFWEKNSKKIFTFQGKNVLKSPRFLEDVCVCVDYLECIAGEVEKSWQSTSSEIDISVHKQVLKSHLHLWQLHSHTAAAFIKL
jgi:hypothetical protein